MDAQLWWQQQRVRKHGGSAAALAETQCWQRQCDVGGGSGSSVAGSAAVAGEGRDVLAIIFPGRA